MLILQIITTGGVTYKNEPWHRECFTCTHCDKSLAGQRFTSKDEKPYCAECFGELFAKRCTACSKPITGINLLAEKKKPCPVLLMALFQQASGAPVLSPSKTVTGTTTASRAPAATLLWSARDSLPTVPIFCVLNVLNNACCKRPVKESRQHQQHRWNMQRKGKKRGR